MSIIAPMVFNASGGAAPPPPGGATTWDPAHTDEGITLSNGNLTGTGNGSSGNGGRGTNSHNTGKWYFEIHNDTDGSFENVGVGNGAYDTAQYPGFDPGGNTSAGMFNSFTPNIYVNHAAVTTGPTYTTGDYIGVALDVGANLIWWRKTSAPTIWNAGAGADPATGAGGIDISGVGGPYFPALGLGNAVALTANFGASGFNAAAPSGFTAWG
jgi:hypothetical protein